MSEVFRNYGKYYDLLYQDKDYEKECNFIEDIFRRYSQKPVETILDAGCGTGGHAIPLAKRGYRVSGFDASEIMIQRAKEKSKAEGIEIEFRVADICDFNMDMRFDACICMFAVINYLTKNDQIQHALANIRRHLNPDGLFIFDSWNGLAVLRILPEVRVKIVEGEGKKVIRFVHPELDAFHHLCKDHYQLIVTQGNTIIDEVKETHVIRYLFPQEITHYLEEAGFEVLKICPFLDLEGEVDENVWNMTVIAKAVSEEGVR